VDEPLLLIIRKPTNRLFASLYNFVEFAPVIEDRVEEINLALETCLNQFLWSRLEQLPGLRAGPVASRSSGGSGGSSSNGGGRGGGGGSDGGGSSILAWWDSNDGGNGGGSSNGGGGGSNNPLVL
jgi:hypothetical protein